MSQQKWTTAEKKRLMRLLKKYDIDDYSRIASHLPNKSAEDVAALFRKEIKIREKLEEKVEVKEESIEQPKPEDLPAIDKWISITSGLVGKEYLDFSTHLARVMGIIADLESFPDPDPAAYCPDYRAIYKYLGALLAGRDSEELLQSMRPLESAVILEILHSLQEVLGAADTNVQQHIMKWKYQLITAQKSDPEEKLKCNRKVIENDFTDFIKQHEDGEESDSDSEDEEISNDQVNIHNVGVEDSSRYVRPTALFVNKAAKKRIVKDTIGGSTEAGTVSQSSLTTVANEKLPRRKKKSLIQSVPKRSSLEAPESSVVRGTSEIVNIPGQTKEMPEGDPPNATIIKRRNIVYKPPPKGPEIVLVMPPVNKPIIHREVKPRSFRCTKDGKYMSLDRSSSDVHVKFNDNPVKQSSTKEVSNNSVKQSIKEGKYKSAVRPSQETYVRVGDTIGKQTASTAESSVQTINNENSNDIPSHQEIMMRMNAKLKQVKVPVESKQVKEYSVETKETETKEMETKETETKVDEATGRETETSGDLHLRLVGKETTGPEARGNIHLRLPVVDVGGNLKVQLPAAGIEKSGNIHVHLTPDSIDSGPSQLKVPNTEAGSSESNEKGPIITSVQSLRQGNSVEFFAEPFYAPGPADSQSFGTSTTNDPVAMSKVSNISVMPSARPMSSVASASEQGTLVTPSPGPVALSAVSPGPSNSITPSPGLVGSAGLLERQGESVMPLSLPEQHSAAWRTEFIAEPVAKAKKVKHKKRKAFDKSRYAAFEKSEETSKEPEKIPKKPKLYSLNPFCVPISLLDISK